MLCPAVKGLCKALRHQHRTEGPRTDVLAADDATDDTPHMHDLPPKKCTDRCACEWSDLWVHAACAVLCCCAHQACSILYEKLRHRARLWLCGQNRRKAWVQEAFLGGRNSNKQQQHDKVETRSRSEQKAKRTAVATRNLHSARFL